MRDALSMFDKAVSFCGATRIQVRRADAQRAGLRHLFQRHRHAARRRLPLGAAAVRRGARQRILRPDLHGWSGAAHARPARGARDAASVSLIELTGTLLERYRAQAGRCTIEFLFGAISLLTEADGRIRQSSNQRLLVELGLMKIAGLGQKKNDGVALGTSYPLPPLTGQNAPAANPRHTTSGPSAAPTSATTAATATGTPSTATPAPAAGNAGAAPAAAAIALEAAPRPAGNGCCRTGRRTARNGTHAGKGPGPAGGVPTCRGDKRRIAHRRRIAVVAAEPGTAGSRTETAPEAAEQPQPAVTIDPASGQKLERAARRSRLHPAGTSSSSTPSSSSCASKRHTLRLAALTEVLREEILRSKLEMLNVHRRDRRRGGGARIE